MLYALIVTVCMGTDCKEHVLPERYASVKECRIARNEGMTYAAYRTVGNPDKTFMFECRLETSQMDQVLK